MSGKPKKMFITATVLILTGLIIFAGVMMAMKWNFKGLSTVRYETNTHTITEEYKNISVISKTADIVLSPSENGETRVVCYEMENVKHRVSMQNETLTIEVEDDREWYQHIAINFDTPKITVYIPKGEYGSLSVESKTGDVKIPSDFSFDSIDVSISTGDVKNYASVTKGIKIKTTTGDICVENVSAYYLEFSVTTGDIAASDIDCKNFLSGAGTGDMKLKNVIAEEKMVIEADTGDITFKKCDAGEIYVKTDTGDVSGSLLSKKVFLCETDTGSVKVPKSTVGGRCEITTDTGDIKIEIIE